MVRVRRDVQRVAGGPEGERPGVDEILRRARVAGQAREVDVDGGTKVKWAAGSKRVSGPELAGLRVLILDSPGRLRRLGEGYDGCAPALSTRTLLASVLQAASYLRGTGPWGSSMFE